MKRELKNMYTEMILDTIINEKWRKDSRTNWGTFYASTINYFKSNRKSVDNFYYIFECELSGLFSKKVKVFVSKDSIYETKTDTLRYSILSTVYWRIVQMDLDIKNSRKIAETNLYMDTYKAFKKSVVQRDIAQIEESLANLSKVEIEQREMLKQLKGE